ncbi:prolyl oligopeptidase [Xylaria sp. CBS 124048]|nr:prolyl oligopeptidase [Xylaria sp. CBS 124048]
MTICATKFTPEVLLSAPRRSPATPNSTGKLAIYTVSQYSFETHSKKYAIKLLDISSGSSTELFDNPAYTEPTWVSEHEFIFVHAVDSNDAASCLMLADASNPAVSPYVIQSFQCPVANLKVKDIGDGNIALALTASTTPSGAMVNTLNKTKSHSTARVYSGLFVRHWDAYVSSNKSAVFYGALRKDGDSGKYQLQGKGLVNALAGAKLECPVPPFGGAGDFDIGKKGLVFLSKDPELNPALWTKTDVYYVPLTTFTEEKPPSPRIVKTGELQGYSGSPSFSHDGNKLAFTRMRHRQYESDKTRLMLISNIEDLDTVQEFYKTDDGEGGWDLRPESIVWSNDDSELYVTAEQRGRQLVFKLPSNPADAKELPKPLTKEGAVASISNLSSDDGRLFLASTSLTDNSSYHILDPQSQETTLVSSISKEGKTFGLSKSQFDEFWFQGAGDYKCHALVMKPSNFDPEQKYPLAMLIHGGPQGAWGDSWSTRWNPAIYAEQGYVVVMPNPTGSTGYGQKLVDDIAKNWGGRPYEDIVNCFEHVAKEMSFVDIDNAVALGASYGGYMINWIQGHPLGRKFKALVCHDGIFCTLSDWATEELFFVLHDMGGSPWESAAQRALYEKWDPSAFVGAWATPELVIHSELDYRLPISEGLAAFNALQTKGVPSRFLTFSDENHWVLNPENSLVWHREVLGWVNKYTGLENTTTTTTSLSSGVGDSSSLDSK